MWNRITRALLGLTVLALVPCGRLLAQSDGTYKAEHLFFDQPGAWIAATTQNTAYRWNGSSWVVLFDSPSDETLYCVLKKDTAWYVGSSRGLYQIEPIDNPAGTPQASLILGESEGIRALALFDGTLFAASASTLYRIQGPSTETLSPLPQTETINKLVPDVPQQRMLALTDQSLWQWSFPSSHWQALTHNIIAEQIGRDLQTDDVEEDAEAAALPFLRDCIVGHSSLFLATERGVFKHTTGTEWTQLATGSLPTRSVNKLAWVEDRLVAATASGAAQWSESNQRWSRVETLESTPLREVVWHQGKFFVITDRGLQVIESQPRLSAARMAALALEPDIRSVQKAAIRYAEVDPKKIQRWRAQARLKALLPTLNMGYDRDVGTYVTSRGSSDAAETDRIITAEDPSDGFDISLTWQLDELIWNNDQTSIDNRSRLSFQLREAVVDQVTRMYFERKRLLSEPEDDAIVEKQLRVDELTALIDGLTDGYFSDALPQTTRSQ